MLRKDRVETVRERLEGCGGVFVEIVKTCLALFRETRRRREQLEAALKGNKGYRLAAVELLVEQWEKEDADER